MGAGHKGDPKMAEAYQEGLRAVAEAERNQQLWAQGNGNPRMAEAYQEGLKAAEEMKNKQQKWSE